MYFGREALFFAKNSIDRVLVSKYNNIHIQTCTGEEHSNDVV